MAEMDIAYLSRGMKTLEDRIGEMADLLADVRVDIPEPTCSQIDALLRDISEPRKQADRLVRRDFDPEVDYAQEFAAFASEVDSALWGLPDDLEALRDANAQLRDGVCHLGSYCHDAAKLLREVLAEIERLTPTPEPHHD